MAVSQIVVLVGQTAPGRKAITLKCSSPMPGYMREMKSEAVQRGDESGRGIGFSVLGVSKFGKGHPLEAELAAGG